MASWTPPPVSGPQPPDESGLEKSSRPSEENKAQKGWQPPPPSATKPASSLPSGGNLGTPFDSAKELRQRKRILTFVASLVVVALGIWGYQVVRGHFVRVTFTFTLDGKQLPQGKSPKVVVDDGPDGLSSYQARMGRHSICASLENAEPYEKHFWVFWGHKNLGVLPLESSKGSLSVAVNPSPATVIVKRDGVVLNQGDAPLKVEKLPVGDYSLVARRGEYEESRQVTIQRQQLTEAIIDLNLGMASLSADVADAEYRLSGNRRSWQGKLPATIADIPAGSYSLAVNRQGWERTSEIAISRGCVTTNKMEFPYGSVEVTTDPTGLMVATNGEEIGKSPVVLRELKPGQYNLTASDGENDLIAHVNVGLKETAKQAFAFRYSSVQLASVPSGATVIRKGKEIGKTPALLDHIPVGKTTMELRLQGYAPTNFLIYVKEGATASMTAKLISLQYLAYLDDARHAAAASPPDYRRALECINRALQVSPDNAEAAQLRDVYDLQVKAADASDLVKEIKTICTALAADSNNANLLGKLKVKVDRTQPPTTRTQLLTVYYLGKLYTSVGAEAQTALNSLRATNPSAFANLFDTCAVCGGRGVIEKPCPTCRGRGICLFCLGNGNVPHHFDSGSERCPNCNGTGVCLQCAGQKHISVPCTQCVHGKVYSINQARVVYKTEIEQAIACLQPVNNQQAGNREHTLTAAEFYNRGNAKKDKGDYDGAIADYGRAIELAPKFSAAYNNRGIAKKDKGDLDAAITDYDRAIEIDPRDSLAYNNRGVAKNAKGDLDGAIADYDRAIELNPKDATAYKNRGNAKRIKGDGTGASEDFALARKLQGR